MKHCCGSVWLGVGIWELVTSTADRNRSATKAREACAINIGVCHVSGMQPSPSNASCHTAEQTLALHPFYDEGNRGAEMVSHMNGQGPTIGKSQGLDQTRAI